MTISIIRPGALAFLLWGTLVCQSSDAQDSPHWNKDTCQTCHMEATPVPGVVNLQAADAEALCETCHGDRGDALPCRHSSGIPIGSVSLPESLLGSTKNGNVVCTTCHDIVHQCERPRIHFSLQNRGFLRDRTSHTSSDYCLKCHDAGDYEKLNPHLGVTGNPPRPTCLLCHATIPETSDTGGLRVEFNVQHDLNDLCLGCHDVAPHPKSLFAYKPTDEWVHFVQPSSVVLSNMRESRTETGIELPLNPQNGEVFCATCHNPHDFKVGGEHGSQDREIEHRLRQHDICQACHDK